MQYSFTAVMAATMLIASIDAMGALPQRTFVSVAGNDVNTASNCSLAAPCRSFASALTVTATNGEIIVLDSGGYGRVTIDRSVAIIAPPGIYAGISVFSGTNGIDINTPGVNVTLKGLTLNGQGGDSGIDFQQGVKLVVENCEIANVGNVAVYARAPDSFTTIKDTVVRGFGFIGIWAFQATAGIKTQVSVENTTIANGGGWALYAGSTGHLGTAVVYANNLSIIGNAASGAVADSQSGGPTLVSIVGSTISGNLYGLVANDPGSRVVASRNRIVRNANEGMINNGGGSQTIGTIGTIAPL